jgi:hypothetical protein
MAKSEDAKKVHHYCGHASLHTKTPSTSPSDFAPLVLRIPCPPAAFQPDLLSSFLPRRPPLAGSPRIPLSFQPVPSSAGKGMPEGRPEAPKQRIRALGEALDLHCKRQQALHPKLTITGMYNVLEKLRSGGPRDDKERVIHEQGLVSVLKQIHDDFDAAVFDAYGWPATLNDEEILERLVALNHERAEEEQRGLVRWPRPEFQKSARCEGRNAGVVCRSGARDHRAYKGGQGEEATKPAWPKGLPARVVAVRDLLAETGEATAAEFPRRYKGGKAAEAEKLLESLATVGVAIETTARSGADRAWRMAAVAVVNPEPRDEFARWRHRVGQLAADAEDSLGELQDVGVRRLQARRPADGVSAAGCPPDWPLLPLARIRTTPVYAGLGRELFAWGLLAPTRRHQPRNPRNPNLFIWRVYLVPRTGIEPVTP